MKTSTIILVASYLLVMFPQSELAGQIQPPDLILRSGKIVTVNRRFEIAQSHCGSWTRQQGARTRRAGHQSDKSGRQDGDSRLD